MYIGTDDAQHAEEVRQLLDFGIARDATVWTAKAERARFDDAAAADDDDDDDDDDGDDDDDDDVFGAGAAAGAGRAGGRAGSDESVLTY